MKFKSVFIMMITTTLLVSCTTQKSYQNTVRYNFTVEYANQNTDINLKSVNKQEITSMTMPTIPLNEIQNKLKYPEQMRFKKIEATVRLRLYISEEGDINKIIVLNTPDQSFIDASLAAINGEKCSPAKDSQGNPIKSSCIIPISFKLD